MHEDGPPSDHIVERRSILTCPACGYKATETMPLDACVWSYDCKACGKRLKAKPGDCCVFCSYGSIACPPIQTQGAGITGSACCTG